MTEKESKALAKAVEVLYFDDNSDYGSALWSIVKILGGQEAADLLEEDSQAAYDKYASQPAHWVAQKGGEE